MIHFLAYRPSRLPAAYPVEPDIGCITIAFSLCWHPLAFIANRPLDIMISGGNEFSGPGWAWRYGGSVSRRMHLAAGFHVSPRVGLEWNRASIQETHVYYGVPRPARSGSGDVTESCTFRVIEIGAATDFTLASGRRITLDNALRTWRRPDWSYGLEGRVYEYVVTMGVSLPR